MCIVDTCSKFLLLFYFSGDHAKWLFELLTQFKRGECEGIKMRIGRVQVSYISSLLVSDIGNVQESYFGKKQVSYIGELKVNYIGSVQESYIGREQVSYIGRI